jgi:hypothetical protein
MMVKSRSEVYVQTAQRAPAKKSASSKKKTELKEAA